MTEKEYPRCSEIESWEYVVQCSESKHLHTKFVIELYKDLKKEQTEEIENQDLRVIINDIQIFMRNERDPEYETNQGDFGVKWAFCGIIVRVWFETNFGVIKYGSYNRIII